MAWFRQAGCGPWELVASSSDCNALGRVCAVLREDLGGGFPAEGLAAAVVHEPGDVVAVSPGDLATFGRPGQERAREAAGVFLRSALPGMSWGRNRSGGMFSRRLPGIEEPDADLRASGTMALPRKARCRSPRGLGLTQGFRHCRPSRPSRPSRARAWFMVWIVFWRTRTCNASGCRNRSPVAICSRNLANRIFTQTDPLHRITLETLAAVC